MTTKLEEKLRALIEAGGPIPISDYMAACLFDPQHGYYTTREPFGRSGDFTTAPEISQMFGEIIGAWLVHAWYAVGRPSPFVLAEMGPGRGTMMRDILRTASLDASFLAAAQVHLVETSERLQTVQRGTLSGAPAEVSWSASLDALPALPLLLVANELFDAVPLRQFEKTAEGWRERRIGLVQNGGLGVVLGAKLADPSILPSDARDAPAGSIFEYAPAREAIANEISQRLVSHGGAALVVDYGHTVSACGDTFQAVAGHRPVSVLAAPGEADLTSHVDFEALGKAAASTGATVFETMKQGDFLVQLGLLERAGALGRGKDAATQEAITAAVNRLAGDGPEQMGALFKVMCIADREHEIAPFAAAEQ